MKSLLKKVAYFIYVLFLLYSLDVRCQTIVKSKEIPFVRDIKNKNILKITKNVYGNAWIEFKNEVNTTPEEVFVNNKTAFGLNENDQMILVKENTDIFGITHYRYQQYHKDFKVEGGEYIVHSVDNKVIRANGKIVENINISSATITDSTTAIRIALDTISKILNIINFENIAIKHELVITKIGNSEFSNNKNYKLAYKFNIEFTSNQLNFIVYIDAINCEILKMLKINYSIVGCQTGHVLTEYYGDKDIEIYQNVLGIHNLECGGFHTRYWGKKWDGSYEYKDNKNNNDYWGTNSERKSATAHWVAQEASKYFLNEFNRWGPDENGNTVEIYVGGPDKDGSIKYIASTYPSNSPQQIYISCFVQHICALKIHK